MIYLLVAFNSENRIFLICDGQKPIELSCGKTDSYRKTLNDIRNRSEWKESGRGARFMGTDTGRYIDDDLTNASAEICGLCFCDDSLLYSYNLDSSGGISRRSLERDDKEEGHILAKEGVRFSGISCKGSEIVFALGSSSQTHIAKLTLPSSIYDEITDGDSSEETPVWSKSKSNAAYYSSAGFARDKSGRLAEKSSYGAACCDFDRMQLDEIADDENFDHLLVRDDSFGNIYYIKQPHAEKSDYSIADALLDVLLFPVRFVKTIFGFLNFLAIHFAGESLKTVKNGTAKAKQKSEEELFIDGNLINVKKNLKASQRSGDKFPSIMPKSRTLVKRNQDGTEEIVAKGVLSFDVAENGDIVYSNGKYVILLKDNEETELAKVNMAVNLCIKQ